MLLQSINMYYWNFLTMKSTLYDNIFRYLSDNTLPSIIIVKKSCCNQELHVMARDYMLSKDRFTRYVLKVFQILYRFDAL